MAWTVVSGPATIDKDTGEVQVTGAGTITIQAVKAGGDSYEGATAEISFSATNRPSSGGDTGVVTRYPVDVEDTEHGSVAVSPITPSRAPADARLLPPRDGRAPDETLCRRVASPAPSMPYGTFLVPKGARSVPYGMLEPAASPVLLANRYVGPWRAPPGLWTFRAAPVVLEFLCAKA